jgi:transposase
MNLHLAAISADVAPGRHAALLLDQAGWHLSGKLAVPDNITIVPLPAKCPELNPQENVWQYMRDNWTCATTGSPTACSRIRMISSITAVTLGTGSRLYPRPSCPSDYAIGHMGSDQ